MATTEPRGVHPASVYFVRANGQKCIHLYGVTLHRLSWPSAAVRREKGIDNRVLLATPLH